MCVYSTSTRCSIFMVLHILTINLKAEQKEEKKTLIRKRSLLRLSHFIVIIS